MPLAVENNLHTEEENLSTISGSASLDLSIIEDIEDNDSVIYLEDEFNNDPLNEAMIDDSESNTNTSLDHAENTSEVFTIFFESSLEDAFTYNILAELPELILDLG